MQITTPKKPLLTLLTHVEPAAARKSAMPALSTIQLTAGSNELHAAATDLYLSMSDRIEIDTPKDAGSIAVNARDIIDRVKAMPDDAPVTLETDGDKLIVKAKSRKFTVYAFAMTDMPQVPAPPAKLSRFAIATETLARLIARTRFSISTDETRAHVNSAKLEIGKGIATMVSTDGHRLSLAREEIGGEAQHDILIPLSAVTALDKFIGHTDAEELSCGVHKGTLFVQAGSAVLGTKLVEAQFPPYSQVIPKSVAGTARVPRRALLDAVSAVSVSASDRTGGVALTFGSSAIRVTSESPERGAGFDEVPCEYDGKELKIGVNAKYIADALGAVSADEVNIGVGGELDPMLMTVPGDESALFVLMPLRI